MLDQDIPQLLETIRTALFSGQISATKVNAQRAFVLLEDRIKTLHTVAKNAVASQGATERVEPQDAKIDGVTCDEPTAEL